MFDFLKRKKKIDKIDINEINEELDAPNDKLVLNSTMDWISYINEDLSIYENTIIHDIESTYKSVKVQSLKFDVRIVAFGSITSGPITIGVDVKCLYHNGPKADVIRDFIFDKLTKIVSNYSGNMSNGDIVRIDIVKCDTKRIYSDKLILEQGEKYLSCTTDCKNLPYDMLTIKKRCVKMGDINYSIYDLVIEELSHIDNIDSDDTLKE